MRHFTRERLQSSLDPLGVHASHAVFPALEAASTEPDRHYHGTRHIGECLAQFQNFRHLAVPPAEIETAVWFHDAIHDTHRNDNEQRGADWARDFLRDERVSGDHIRRIHAMITATRLAAPVDEPDRQLPVDVDLGSLGRPLRG